MRRVRSRASFAAARAREAITDFWTTRRASGGFSSSQDASFSFVARSTSERIETLPSLRLRLSLELRIAKAYGDDRGQPFADVFAGEVRLLLLEDPLLTSVAVNDVRECLLEPLFVHPTFGSFDAVRERVDPLVVAGVPLHRDLDLLGLFLHLVPNGLAEQRLLRVVEVLHEVDDPAVVFELLLLLPVRALVDESDVEPVVEERVRLKTLEDRLRAELDALCREDLRVGPERDVVPVRPRGALPTGWSFSLTLPPLWNDI